MGSSGYSSVFMNNSRIGVLRVELVKTIRTPVSIRVIKMFVNNNPVLSNQSK